MILSCENQILEFENKIEKIKQKKIEWNIKFSSVIDKYADAKIGIWCPKIKYNSPNSLAEIRYVFDSSNLNLENWWNYTDNDLNNHAKICAFSHLATSEMQDFYATEVVIHNRNNFTKNIFTDQLYIFPFLKFNDHYVFSDFQFIKFENNEWKGKK